MRCQNVRVFMSPSTAALPHGKYASAGTCPDGTHSGNGWQWHCAWRCVIHSVVSGVETVLQYCLAQHVPTRLLDLAPQKTAIWISRASTFSVQRTNAMQWHPTVLLWLSVQVLNNNRYETKKGYKINFESTAQVWGLKGVNNFEGVGSSQLSAILPL